MWSLRPRVVHEKCHIGMKWWPGLEPTLVLETSSIILYCHSLVNWVSNQLHETWRFLHLEWPFSFPYYTKENWGTGYVPLPRSAALAMNPLGWGGPSICPFFSALPHVSFSSLLATWDKIWDLEIKIFFQCPMSMVINKCPSWGYTSCKKPPLLPGQVVFVFMWVFQIAADSRQHKRIKLINETS